MSGMEGALLEVGKQAAISMGAQKLANEANAALGQTRQSGIQPQIIQPQLQKLTTNVEKQLGAKLIQEQPIAKNTLDERLDKVLGGLV